MNLCRGPQCSKPVVAKGLCQSHYKQLQRDGTLRIIVDPYQDTPESKFFRTIQKNDNGCWVWQGPVDKGYGRMYVNKKVYQAHRWSYEHHKHVRLKKEETLDHLCRNTLCCNPEHLEKVSLIENIERQHLYHAMKTEIDRLRGFLIDIGYDPDTLQKEM